MTRYFLTLCFAVSVIFSQQYDSLKTYETEQIVVTGTRIQTLRRHLPLTISVISPSELKLSSKTEVFTMLDDKVPGFMVKQRSYIGFGLAQGSAGQVSLRGLGSNPNTQVLILLDGRPQFMGLFGHPLPDNYISANVDKVEVVRGPCSFLYGTNAMGGVINLISKRAVKDGFSVNLTQTYGTFATLTGDAGIGYKKNNADIYFSASYRKSNGERPYSGFNLNNGFLKAGYKFGKNYDAVIDANITGFKTYDPGPVNAPKTDNWVDIFRGNAGINIDNSYKKSEGSLRFIYNYGEHKIYDGFHSKDRNINFSFYQTLKLNSGTNISAGLDYKYYGGEAENTKSGLDYGEHFLNEYGAYLHVQQLLLTKLALNGGLRFERSSQFGNEIIPQAGISYEVIKGLTARVNVSKGFRSPTIRELYLFPAPTPELKPERLWNYEAGLIFTYKNIITVEPVIYFEKCENIIQQSGVYPNLKLSNSGKFEKKGYEISVKSLPVKGISLNTGYSYIDNGSQTMGNFTHKFYAGGDFSYKIARLNVSFQYVSGLYNANDFKQKLPDYALLNAVLTVSPLNELAVYVSAENLTDRKYETIYNYPMPGRTFQLGLKFNY